MWMFCGNSVRTELAGATNKTGVKLKTADVDVLWKLGPDRVPRRDGAGGAKTQDRRCGCFAQTRSGPSADVRQPVPSLCRCDERRVSPALQELRRALLTWTPACAADSGVNIRAGELMNSRFLCVAALCV